MAYSGISGMLHIQDLHSFESYLVREYTYGSPSERPVYLSRDFNSCLLSLEHLEYLVSARVSVRASVDYHCRTASQTQEPQKRRDER